MDINTSSMNSSNQSNSTRLRLNIEKFSWSAIISGVFMTLAIFITLMLLGLSLGLAVMDFKNGISLTATGFFTGIWTVLSFLVALGVATYVTAGMTGYSSRVSAVLNGLTIWAVVSLTIFYFVTKSSGRIVANSASAVSNQVQDMAQTASAGLLGQGQFPELNLKPIEDAYNDFDAPELKSSVEKELKSLKAQANSLGKQILINPDSAKSNIERLKASAKGSVAKLRREFDKEKIAAIISRNSSLTPNEAQQAAQEWSDRLNNISNEMEKLFNNVESKVVKVADSAKNSVAATSFLMFVFLSLGFFVSVLSSSMAMKNYSNQK